MITFDTVNKVCEKHGVDSVFVKLTTDKRAQHICVKCCLEVLQQTTLPANSVQANTKESKRHA